MAEFKLPKNSQIVEGDTHPEPTSSGEKKVFKIVGHEEADIDNNLISYKSPVAKELIGKEKDDFVMVNTPKGEKSYEITAILYE